MTSNLPFGALLSGHQSWAALTREMKWGNATLAVCVALAMATFRRPQGLARAVR
jgi:hypothetical protein|eukprot:COSAG01_NODE_34967_length_539_cov_0.815909_1_plen_54_part_00